MRIVQVYDAARRPADWMAIIQPAQFAVFASRIEGGDPCDVDGGPAPQSGATCGIADSLAEAEQFCRDTVAVHPDVRFDIFDAAGRARPPLVTVVHPSRSRQLDGDPGSRRRHRAIALVLIVLAPVLIWIDWRYLDVKGLPSLLAFNLLLFAMRLLMIAAGHAANERKRLARLAGRDESGPL
ncbi:MAG TPA: hypothetical protein VMF13_07525 [Luteitalea sp.]|nr:hypothetical protein [Luteitalea sp.]